MKRVVLMIIVSVMAAGSASAQTYYPGSVWSSTGTLSSVEKHNILSFTHVEQGIARSGAEMYALTTLETATATNDWEHRTEIGGGVRFTQSLRTHGMIRFNTAYVSETRYLSHTTRAGLQVSADVYLGWHQKPTPKPLLLRPLRP